MNKYKKPYFLKVRFFTEEQGNPLVVFLAYKEGKCKIVVTHS